MSLIAATTSRSGCGRTATGIGWRAGRDRPTEPPATQAVRYDARAAARSSYRHRKKRRGQIGRLAWSWPCHGSCTDTDSSGRSALVRCDPNVTHGGAADAFSGIAELGTPATYAPAKPPASIGPVEAASMP